jgi:surface-adhesin protein E
MFRSIRCAFLAMTSLLAFLPGAVCAAPDARWHELAATPVGRLSLDTASIHGTDAQKTFRYRIDHNAEQKNAGTGKAYRSTVIDATVDCVRKTMAKETLRAYSENAGGGKLVDQVAMNEAPAVIAVQSSNDMLRRAVCNTPAPDAAPARR